MLALPTPSGSSAIAGAPRATGTRPLGGFAVRAAVLVAAIQIALVAALHLGWLSAPAYALVAVLLPSAAVGWLAQAHAQLLRRLRRAMRQFEAGAPDEGARVPAAPDASHDLAERLERLHVRTLERVEELKAARMAAQLAGRGKAAAGAAPESRAAHRPRRQLGMGARHQSRRLLGRAPAHAGNRRGAPRRHARRRCSRTSTRTTAAPSAAGSPNLARGRTAPGLDARVSTRNGEFLQVRVMGEAVGIADGSASGVVGTVQDATEHAEAIQRDPPARVLRRADRASQPVALPREAGGDARLRVAARRRRSRSCSSTSTSSSASTTRSATPSATSSCASSRSGSPGVLRVDDATGPSRGNAPERDVCRQGGDEFVVLLAGVATEEHAARAARRVIDTLAQPIRLSTQEVFVSASIGIVLYPRDGNGLDTLLRNADVAMYHAKAEGRNRHAFYRESMREATAHGCRSSTTCAGRSKRSSSCCTTSRRST